MELYLLDILLVSLVVLYTFIASIFDIKTREVPDLLNYSLVVVALSLRLIFSIISNNYSFFLFGLLGFLIFFLVANLMYYTKQWGGGDAKLLMGLGAAIPAYPKSLLEYLTPSLNQVPFLLILFLNLIVAGALYAVLYSIVIGIKNKNQIKKNFVQIINSSHIQKIRKIVVFGSLATILFALIQRQSLLRLIISICVFSALFLFYLVVYLKAAEKSYFIKRINVKKLTPGDWITHKLTRKDVVLYDPRKSYGVTKEQIQKIIYSNIKEVEIKQGIPFVPSFFIAVLLSLFYGNIIFYLFGL